MVRSLGEDTSVFSSEEQRFSLQEHREKQPVSTMATHILCPAMPARPVIY